MLKTVKLFSPLMLLCPCRYILYEDTGSSDGYKARRVPEVGPARQKWPPEKTEGSPYSVITHTILELMQKDETCELHVTGHR